MYTCSSGWPLWPGEKLDSDHAALRPQLTAANRSAVVLLRPRLRVPARAQMLPIPINFLLDAFHRAGPPVNALRNYATDHSAGPNQFIGREQSPCFIALDDAARDELAGNRGIIQPVASETARQP